MPCCCSGCRRLKMPNKLQISEIRIIYFGNQTKNTMKYWKELKIKNGEVKTVLLFGFQKTFLYSRKICINKHFK